MVRVLAGRVRPAGQSGPEDDAAPSSTAVAGGAGIALAGQLIATGFRFLNGPLAARVLSPEAFGLYRLALSVAAVLTVLIAGGLQNAVLALIPRRRAQQETLGAETLGSATWYALGISGVLAVLTVRYKFELANFLGQPEASLYLAIVIASLPFGVLLVTTQAGARSVFAFREAVVPGNILQPILLAGLVFGVFVRHGSPLLVPWAYTASGIAAGVVATAAVVRLPEFGGRWLRPRWPDGELLRLSAPFLAITLLQILNESIMVFILGRTSTAANVGLYAAADRAAALVASVLIAMNLVFAPVIAALWTQQSMARLHTFFRRITKWTLALAVPLCLVMILAGEHVLRIFGQAYAGASMALALLAVGQLVNAGTGAVGYLLILTGHHRIVVITFAASLLASIGLGIAVVPTWGISGAAAVSAAVLGGLNVAMLVQVWRRLRMQPYAFDTLRVVAAGAGAAAVGWILSRQTWGTWPVRLLVVAGGIILCYGILLILLAVTAEDRDLLRMVIQNARGRGTRVARQDRPA